MINFVLNMMKTLFCLWVMIFFGFSTIFAETIRFAPLPYQTKETLIGSHLPLVDYLKKKTGLSVELVYISEYYRLFEDFKNGKVDLITAGPLPYVEIKKSFEHAQAIAFFREKDGSTKYSCVLITSARGPNKVKDIKGPIALTQKGSTCGYFTANILLSKEGKDIKQMKYTHLNSHNEVAESVIRQEYEVGSLKKRVAEQYKGFAIKMIAESLNWPAITIIANTKTLSKDKIRIIKDALISISPEESKSLVDGKFGFAEAKEKDFEIVKKYERFIK